jgi:glycosyltransferase involved in cell wall biosynthesis
VREAGGSSVDVGIGIADAFHYTGEPKVSGTLAYLPRRGVDFAEAVLDGATGLTTVALDGLDEGGLAGELKAASFFLASARGEWFGLPALEAMAAGCLVLSAPVLGGREYLHSEVNSVVGEPEELRAALARLAADQFGAEATRMRLSAMATAASYSMSVQRRRLSRSLAEGWLDDLR